MADVYTVVLQTTAKNMPTILKTVNGVATLVSVTATIKETDGEPAKRRNGGYVGGRANKGIRGEDLVLEVLSAANRVVTYHEMTERFAARGFAGNSVSATLSRMVQDGRVRRVGSERYALPGTVVKLGDLK
jgi:hypothetical protein